MKGSGTSIFIVFSLLGACAHNKTSYKNSFFHIKKHPNQKQTLDKSFMQSETRYHFMTADLHSQKGDFKQAIHHFNKALLHEPQSLQLRVRVAIELIRMKKLDKARKEALWIQQMHPQEIDGHLLLAELDYIEGRYDEALAMTQKLLSKHKKEAKLFEFMALIYKVKKDFKKSLSFFKKLVAHSKNKITQARAYSHIASLYQTMGFRKKAEKAFKKSLKLQPEKQETVFSYYAFLEEGGRGQEATELLSHFQSQYTPVKLFAGILVEKHAMEGKYEEAIQQLHEMIRVLPNNKTLLLKEIELLLKISKHFLAKRKISELLKKTKDKELHFYLGVVNEELKKYKQAVLNFSKVPESSRHYARARRKGAKISYIHLKDADKALYWLGEAILHSPKDVQSYSLYSRILEEKKGLKEAISFLKESVSLIPDLSFYLGDLYYKSKDFSKSIFHFNKVIEKNPHHILALNYLAYVHIDADQDLEKGHELAHKALSLDPENPYILDTVGWSFFKKKQYPKALTFLEKAYALLPQNSDILIHLAEAYRITKDFLKSEKMYKLALNVLEDSEKVNDIKRKLAEQAQATKRLPASFSP